MASGIGARHRVPSCAVVLDGSRACGQGCLWGSGWLICLFRRPHQEPCLPHRSRTNCPLPPICNERPKRPPCTPERAQPPPLTFWDSVKAGWCSPAGCSLFPYHRRWQTRCNGRAGVRGWSNAGAGTQGRTPGETRAFPIHACTACRAPAGAHNGFLPLLYSFPERLASAHGGVGHDMPPQEQPRHGFKPLKSL